VVNIWNSLPDYVVDVDDVDVFKKRLDKFWSSQPVKFDWRASLTGTGDRSEFAFEKVDSLSENRHWRCGHRGLQCLRPLPRIVLSCLCVWSTNENQSVFIVHCTVSDNRH